MEDLTNEGRKSYHKRILGSKDPKKGSLLKIKFTNNPQEQMSTLNLHLSSIRFVYIHELFSELRDYRFIDIPKKDNSTKSAMLYEVTVEDQIVVFPRTRKDDRFLQLGMFLTSHCQ